MFTQATRERYRGVQEAEQFVPGSEAGKRSRHASESAGFTPQAASFQRSFGRHSCLAIDGSVHAAVAPGKSQHSDGTDTTRRLETVSHYRVIEKVGEGGMAIVYRARDLKLGRPVALKFLAPHLSSDVEATRRLKKEARLASSLNHPNICSIYDIDQVAGQSFIVTEFLEGETLAQLLLHKIPSVREVLDYAIQMSEALAAAHGRGIIHGDVKPSNVFLTTEGRIKLLDFGLSRASESKAHDDDSTDRLDEAYTVSGTFQYMSPEQARGRKTDRRSDIFSFGVVCYELVTGCLPFEGDTAGEILTNIIDKEPVSIDLLRPDIPTDFERVIRKCLRKKPELRYQDADELLEDLRPLVSRQASEGRITNTQSISVAVLPFLNLSGETEDLSFSRGITEEIAVTLSRMPGVSIASPWRPRDQGVSQFHVSRIGRKVGVELAVQGSVQRVGKCIRITARLINVADGLHLWAEAFDRNADDMLAVQDEIAMAIAQALQGCQPVAERELSGGKCTTELETSSYVRGVAATALSPG